MADITIRYNGSAITELSATGSKIINTAGKYCTDNITVQYTHPEVNPNIIDASNVSIITVDGRIIPVINTGGATNIVQGDFTTGSTRKTTGTFSIDYTGSGYPISLTIYVKGGPYNNDSSTGNTTWYSSLNRYDVGFYSMVKARVPNAPTYDTSGADNYGTAMITYKNSTSESTTYTRAGAVDNNVYTSSSTVAEASTKCVKFKGDGKTVSYYVGNHTSSTIGFPPSTEFSYIAIYSS